MFVIIIFLCRFQSRFRLRDTVYYLVPKRVNPKLQSRVLGLPMVVQEGEH